MRLPERRSKVFRGVNGDAFIALGICIFAALLLAVTPSLAQQSPQRSAPDSASKANLERLSLQDAIERARRNDPQFQSALTDAGIAKEDRVSLMIDRNERHFSIRSLNEKNEAHEFLSSWLRQLPPPELSAAIGDLCKRYSVDLAALTREAMMDWSDLERIADDPLVTIGCATVNYPVLSNLKEAGALREMTMGKAVAEAAFHREVRHFAFPFGDRDSFRRAHVVMARDAGFSSAVSTIAGIVDTAGRTNLYALPRIAWDGRIASLRAMRVVLSGATFPAIRPTQKPEV